MLTKIKQYMKINMIKELIYICCQKWLINVG